MSMYSTHARPRQEEDQQQPGARGARRTALRHVDQRRDAHEPLARDVHEAESSWRRASSNGMTYARCVRAACYRSAHLSQRAIRHHERIDDPFRTSCTTSRHTASKRQLPSGVAHADYRRVGNALQMIHTEVPDSSQNRGVAAALVDDGARLRAEERSSRRAHVRLRAQPTCASTRKRSRCSHPTPAAARLRPPLTGGGGRRRAPVE